MSLEIRLVTNPIRVNRDFTTWVEDPAPFYEIDTEVVKPALLYADKVQLRSYLQDIRDINARYAAGIFAFPLHDLRKMLGVARMPPEHMALYGLDPAVLPDPSAALDWESRMEEIWSSERVEAMRSGGDQEAIRRFISDAFDLTARFVDDWPKAPEQLAKLGDAAISWRESGDYSKLEPAVESGLLTITGWSDVPPGTGEIFADEQAYLDRAAEEVLAQVATDEAMLYLGFGAQRMLGLEDSPSQHREDLVVASTLLSHLPAFSQATVQEIVDIRSELRDPLVRFRAAVVRLRSEMAGLAPEEVGVHVRDHYHGEVAPALADIDHQIRTNRYLSQLADTWMKASSWGKAAAGVGLAIGPLADVAGVIAIAAGVSFPFAEAAWNKTRGSRDLARSDYYLLHQIQATSRK